MPNACWHLGPFSSCQRSPLSFHAQCNAMVQSETSAKPGDMVFEIITSHWSTVYHLLSHWHTIVLWCNCGRRGNCHEDDRKIVVSFSRLLCPLSIMARGPYFVKTCWCVSERTDKVAPRCMQIGSLWYWPLGFTWRLLRPETRYRPANGGMQSLNASLRIKYGHLLSTPTTCS
jgi:hypothetical protein